MTYLLISLFSPDDPPSIDSNGLSVHLETRRSAGHVLRGDHPSLDEVRHHAPRLQSGTVVFGHNGGGSLRAHASSDRAWVNPEDFGGAAANCRVYAYACETLVEGDDEAFGFAAVRAGVRVFVGHSQVIQSPDSERGFTQAQLDCLRTSALGAIERFLDGEEREGHLRLALDDGALADDPSFMTNILDLDETGGSVFFNASIVLQRLQSSLRVYHRAAATESAE